MLPQKIPAKMMKAGPKADTLCLLVFIPQNYGIIRNTSLCLNCVIMDAKAQLSSTKKRVSEISDDLNFASPSFFGKYFKRLTGLSPKAFREAEQSIEHTPMPVGSVTGVAGNTF